MKTKSNKQWKVGSIAILSMILLTIGLAMMMGMLVEQEIIMEQVGIVGLKVLLLLGIYGISWYTAKQIHKMRMQMILLIVCGYLAAFVLIEMIAFPQMGWKFDYQIVLPVISAVLACLTANMKKERKR